jgi:hypothetical protein
MICSGNGGTKQEHICGRMSMARVRKWRNALCDGAICAATYFQKATRARTPILDFASLNPSYLLVSLCLHELLASQRKTTIAWTSGKALLFALAIHPDK